MTPSDAFPHSLALVIGRFQMPHQGHLQLLHTALQTAPYVLCFLGSALRASDTSNTFDFSTRKALLQSALTPEQRARVLFVPLRDYYDDTLWCQSILDCTARFAGQPKHYLEPSSTHGLDDGSAPISVAHYLQHHLPSSLAHSALSLLEQLYPQWAHMPASLLDQSNCVALTPHAPQINNIALVGHFKDNSSYYLRLFPQFDLVQAPSVYLPNQQPPACIDATPLRQAYLHDAAAFFNHASAALVPSPMYPILEAFSQTLSYARTARLVSDLQEYKKQYPAPCALTADSIVTHQDRVLLIERNSRFGDGLLAMPGGFCDPGEFLTNASVRELHEETGLDLADHSHTLVAQHMATHPKRSERTRIVSEIFHYQLDAAQPCPMVHAQDDAGGAYFIDTQLLPLLEPLFFEDHFAHLQKRLGFTPLNSMDLSCYL